MPAITRESALTFVSQLRSARLAVLADGEAFDEIIHVVERLGSYLSKERLGDKGEYGTLGKYKPELAELALGSALADGCGRGPTPFGLIYDLVTTARNDALHQGASARHLTKHTIELAIILEDALNNHVELVVADFMVRDPVCAQLWQPVGFIRQQMLANSYSYLPICRDDGSWGLLSDAAIATFLGAERNGKVRTERLAQTIRQAVTLDVRPATFVRQEDPLAKALASLAGAPVLLVEDLSDPKRLLGILTAFDLL